ncbi:MAG: MarR family transcriptional regulator [Pseudonocardia sp.]|uniref:MarR family winged helix-turn-helix transcriptional regulator n=1 Tax=unclassified Pseudonocardia TaxID=2619320 RepID=UPI0008689298|nr:MULTISPECIES: MarR family transcriptional regulator [unclassified Pseudonocardia]MBN9111623.1 MarR family transcriptional regulator [Pseudonocardia sp.]ODU26507.1 MAG: MarR family transcriptional regulator [Pseudonocardia sp. SCN 72-51]ODU98221.1 MAG: MarR family transcriptional regulator [Pseudonocardia sp. SCN 73-27]
MTRWLDAREQRAWRGYIAMQAQLNAELHRRMQAESGLSLADFDVLVALTDRASERMRVLELAEALQWEKSRLSHHLSRMQKRGLIEREDCPDDARGAFVLLSAEGRRAIDAAAPPHVAAVRELVFDGLDDADVDALARIAEAVLARIAAPR